MKNVLSWSAVDALFLVRQWNRMKLYFEIYTLRVFACLGDRVSTDGRCEAAMTARTRFGW